MKSCNPFKEYTLLSLSHSKMAAIHLDTLLTTRAKRNCDTLIKEAPLCEIACQKNASNEIA